MKKNIDTFWLKKSTLSRAMCPIVFQYSTRNVFKVHIIFFLFLHQWKGCGYSLEAPCWGTSNDYPQPMCLWRNMTNIMWIPSLIWSYADYLFWQLKYRLPWLELFCTQWMTDLFYWVAQTVGEVISWIYTPVLKINKMGLVKHWLLTYAGDIQIHSD